jgi:hypothetical protein
MNTSVAHKRNNSILSDTKFRRLNELDNEARRDFQSFLIEIEDQHLRKIKEMELKNQEYLNEIDALKKAFEKKQKDQETFLSESIQHSNLQHLIHLKENEINEIKKEHELLLKKYIDENNNLKENVDFLEEKIVEYNDLKNENERLKKKAKELEILKEKMLNQEKSVLEIQNKNTQIDILTKEKQKYIQSVDKLQKDIITEKDKNRAIDNEKRKLENEVIDLKRENNKLLKKLEEIDQSMILNGKENDKSDISFRNSLNDIKKRSSFITERRLNLEKDDNSYFGKPNEKIKQLENEVY